MRICTIKIRSALHGSVHLSFDGRNPVCNAAHSYPYSRCRSNVTCKGCKAHIRWMRRRLDQVAP